MTLLERESTDALARS